MNKWTLLLFFFVICAQGKTQETSYTGLKSKGYIPDDFTTLTLEKIKKAQNKKQSQAKSKFYELSNFGIDKLLQSGRVCFNDTISQYVAKVLKEIQKSNPSVPKNLKIYTVKSPVVNAFTTDQGIIFINTGLLAQLENEAQLAFILCHEIIHYTEDHVMEGFLNQTDLDDSKNDYKRTTYIDKELATTRFSRKLENEADEKGLALFLQTKYDPAEVDGVFDVLLYAHLPFDELPFDSALLEVGEYKIPPKYILKKFNDIEVDENIDDSKLTHPNIGTRRKNAKNILSLLPKTGEKFLISENDFFSVRDAARIEVLRLQIINSKYPEALYSAFILAHDNPTLSLPEVAIGEILYGSALFDNSNSDRTVLGDYRVHQGFVQSAYYLLHKLNSKNRGLVALRYNLFLHQKYPQNKTIENRIISLCEHLDFIHDIHYSDLNFSISQDSLSSHENAPPLSEQKKGSTPIVYVMNSDEDKVDLDKEEKIRTSTKKADPNWAQHIFFQSGDTAETKSFFKKGEQLSKKKQYLLGITDDPKKNRKSNRDKERYRKKTKKKGRSLGLNKIVLVDPYYSIYDFTKKDAHKQIESENEEIETLKRFEKTAKQVNLELDILTPYRFDSLDVEKYNDFSLLNEWVNERFVLGGRSQYPSSAEEVQYLVNKYNTKYFAWSGLINTSLPRKNKILVGALSLYFVVAIPYGIYYIASDNRTTHIYFAIFNIETGQLVMYENRPIDMNDTNGLLNSQYYDIFNQIHN